MRSFLRTIYTAAPLMVVVFFFQNCSKSQRPEKPPYAGVSTPLTITPVNVSNQ